MLSTFTSKCWTDTSVLPSNILTLKGYDFFNVIEHLTSDTVADLLRIQAIRNVHVFMLAPNVLSVLQLDSSELEYIKTHACVRLDDDSYIVKAGIKASVRYLRELFAKKINEHYNPDRKQEVEVDVNDNNTDTAVSSNACETIDEKRPAPLSSPRQMSNKRGRK